MGIKINQDEDDVEVKLFILIKQLLNNSEPLSFTEVENKINLNHLFKCINFNPEGNRLFYYNPEELEQQKK